MDTRKKKIVLLVSIFATGVVVLVAVSAVILNIVVNPDRYRPQIVSFLEAKTGKQIELGGIEIHWMRGSVRLYDFGTRNPKPFPAGDFFKAERIDAVLDLAALWHRKIVIKSIAVQNPTINVVSDPDGLWNFENPAQRSAGAPNHVSFGVIPRVTITGGHLLGSSLIDPSDRPGPVVFEVRNLALTLKNADFDAFTGAASTPVGDGDLSADSLRLGKIEVKKVRGHLRMLAKEAFFENASVEADGGRASGNLSFHLAEKVPRFETNVRLSGIDVEQLLASFPNGRRKMTGTMDGEVALAGRIEHTADPLIGIGGRGKFVVRDGDLPTLNSNDHLKQLERFRDPQDAYRATSAFSSFSTDLELAEQRMTSRSIDVAFYGSDLQCSGNLNLDGEEDLHFDGLLKVMKKQGLFTDLFAKVFREAREQGGRLVFPIRISGTVRAPKFALVD